VKAMYFNAAVDEVLGKAQAISNERGGQYQDSWALENQQTPFIDNALRVLGLPAMTREQKRILMLASLSDVKISRMLGPYKADTVEDLLNYLAVMKFAIEEALAE
jgi:hypothetical protein